MHFRLSPSIEIMLRAPPSIWMQQTSCWAASEIELYVDSIGNGDVDVAQLNVAEWNRFERKRFLHHAMEQRLKGGAGERAEFAVALAFDLRDFDYEFVRDVELDVDVDLRARKKFLCLNLNVGGNRTAPARADEQAQLFEFDAVQTRFGSGYADD